MLRLAMATKSQRLANQIESDLRPLGTKRRAEGEKAYLKSELEFLGVTKPEIRQVVRENVEPADLGGAELTALAEALWSKPINERRSAAILALTDGEALLGRPDVALIERFIRDSETWAYVDPLATAVLAPIVERNPSLTRTLDRWSTDENFWIRRTAMLALLPALRRGDGDFDRFGGYAESMLEEKEFFIRKAIGWVLRETAKERPDLVYEWLLPRAPRASGVTIREAVKYLSEAQREEIQAAR
ncbi:MAG: DNA alkylation repair protein [Solirubrobacterales bacterium]